MPGRVGEQVADRNAALPVLAKSPGTFEHVAVVVELRRLDAEARRLTVLAIEARLGVERVDLARAAVHVQEDDAACLRREMRLSRRHRAWLGAALVEHQARERDGAEAIGAACQHLAPSQGLEQATAMHALFLTRKAAPSR